jgi:hypothetical protein
MKKTIVFLGDSFTWGEGLELYCDTPKWKNERFIENEWDQLLLKQDTDAIKFRENNRYPTLISNELNKNIIVDKDNGGSLLAFIKLAESSLYNPHNNIETIIIQMSCLDRESYHIYPHCKCDICVNSNHTHIFAKMYVILEKVYTDKALNDDERFIISFFEKETGYQITDLKFFLEFDKLRFKWYNTTFNEFVYNHVRKWKSNGLRNVYFIDSWDDVSGDAMVSAGIDMIPLIGTDDNLYYRWSDWENTFKYKRINSEFPNTKNAHPTLIQHKYIANSVINFLRK